MTLYLTVDEVVSIHDDQIAQFGGSHGLRDANGLIAAVHRPQSGYYTSITDEAAALWESLSGNHPFIDGNKRTAIVAAATFLAINSKPITSDPADTYKFVVGLYENATADFQNMSVWLAANT